jgi:hypothetical protein
LKELDALLQDLQKAIAKSVKATQDPQRKQSENDALKRVTLSLEFAEKKYTIPSLCTFKTEFWFNSEGFILVRRSFR